ncbi:MAG: hypothetical protein KF799_09620 [Bdellovibrionales bacterium]|nr:hypothetical protein [Bdellovibrionales bacterium]
MPAQRLALLFFSVFTILPVQAEIAKLLPHPKNEPTCSDWLTAARHLEVIRTAQAYKRYHVKILGLMGFEFSLKDGLAPMRNVEIPNLRVPPKDWITETWETNGQSYKFFDVGFSNLASDAMEVASIVFDHIHQHPNENLRVTYGSQRRARLKNIFDFRWAVHSRVLKVYEQEKPYLSKVDYWNLLAVNIHSTNNEVLAILKGDSPVTWDNFSQKQVENDLLSTIQISYMGDIDYFRPTLRAVWKSVGSPLPPPDDLLPFEHRIPEENRKQFRAQLAADFDLPNTCEITRYAKFLNTLPPEVSDRLILTVFDHVLARGINTILVSTDDYTLRLFRRYGVEPYAILPMSGSQKEHLGVVRLDGEKFKAVYARLSERSAGVKITPTSGLNRQD